VLQDFKHRAAGLDDAIGRQTLSQQILASDGTVDKVYVCRVIHDASIDFLWDSLIEATISRFHVKYRYSPPFGGNYGHATIGVAKYQHRIRFDIGQHPVDGPDHVADGLRRSRPGALQKVVGLSQPQIIEEDLVQLVVVVLPRMDQNVFEVFV
jgi:hypothetical protein